jgi:hypothetical protein
MSSPQNFTGRTTLASSVVRLGWRVAAAALASIACLGGLQALWLIGSHREMKAATELQQLGGTVLWEWRLDEMFQEKLAPFARTPHWLVPGDSFVGSVYLTYCGKPQLDQKLVSLESFRNLRYLSLSSTKATDAGLSHLAGLSRLEWLDLGNTSITDDGLRTLAALKSLKYINLSGTRVTLRGVANLRAQLPSAKITSDFDFAMSTS